MCVLLGYIHTFVRLNLYPSNINKIFTCYINNPLVVVNCRHNNHDYIFTNETFRKFAPQKFRNTPYVVTMVIKIRSFSLSLH